MMVGRAVLSSALFEGNAKILLCSNINFDDCEDSSCMSVTVSPSALIGRKRQRLVRSGQVKSDQVRLELKRMAVGEKTPMMNYGISHSQICDAVESMRLVRQDALIGVSVYRGGFPWFWRFGIPPTPSPR